MKVYRYYAKGKIKGKMILGEEGKRIFKKMS